MQAIEKIFMKESAIKKNSFEKKKEFIWISSNEMDETGAHYTEWSKSER